MLINSIKKSFYKPIYRQIFKFACIGTLAALVNLLVVLFLVRDYSWQPLSANIIAFIIAFNVSYYGHRYWTFKAISKISTGSSWIKFLIVAVASFILNEGLFAIFLLIIPYYMAALFLTLICVPPITFLLSKLWAFK